MRLSPLHHSYRDYAFGFKPGVLVYETASEAGPEGLTSTVRTPERPQDQPEQIPGYWHKNTEQGKALEAAVLRYNGLKLNSTHNLQLEYLDAEETYINLAATVSNIDKLLNFVKEEDRTHLLVIRAKLQAGLTGGYGSQELIGQAEAMNPSQVKYYGDRLVLLDKNLSQARETNAGWPSKQIYQKINAFYEENLGKEQFKTLRIDVYGQFDQKKEDENKVLFLTLMAKETGGDFSQLPSQPNGNSKIENLDDPAFAAYTYNKLMAFQEAIALVDQQGGQGNLGEVFHPSIRRAMIENFYQLSQQKPAVEIDSDWVVVQLSQAPYFRAEVPGDDTGNAQRAALAVAFAGGQAAETLSSDEEDLKVWSEFVKENNEITWDAMQLMANDFGIELTSDMKVSRTPQQFFEQTKQTVESRDQAYRQFLDMVRDILQKPFDENGVHPALSKLNNEGDGGLGFIEKGELTQFNINARQTEVNYSTAQLGTKVERGGFLSSFEKMGMDLTQTHRLYMDKLLEDPSVNIEEWEEMLDKDPNKVANIVQSIVRSSTYEGEQQGRKALLVTLRSMSQPSTDPTINQQRQVARNRVMEIKRMIVEQNQLAVKAANPYDIIEKAAEGSKSMKEHIMGPLGKLKDMLFSGDYFDMALAGGILVAGATFIYQGFKNWDKLWGKMVVGGVGVTAIAAAYEEFTGKKVLNTAKKIAPDALEKAAEKTPEMAYVNEASKEVDRNEYLRGQLALRTKPVKAVMEWYESTNPNQPGGLDPEKEARLYRQLDIDSNDVLEDGNDSPEHELEAKRIIKETVARNLEFVAKQRGKPVYKIPSILDEVYIKASERENYVPHERGIITTPGIYREFHGRQNQLTFGEVFKREMNPHLIEKALMAQPWGPVAQPVIDTAHSAVAAVRNVSGTTEEAIKIASAQNNEAPNAGSVG